MPFYLQINSLSVSFVLPFIYEAANGVVVGVVVQWMDVCRSAKIRWKSSLGENIFIGRTFQCHRRPTQQIVRQSCPDGLSDNMIRRITNTLRWSVLWRGTNEDVWVYGGNYNSLYLQNTGVQNFKRN